LEYSLTELKASLKNILYLLLLQVILIALSFLSFKLRSVTDSLLLYLPLVMGIVFIHWFGLRILPILFINGYTTLMIYGVTKFTPLMWFLSIHEAAVAFTSWLLYAKLFPPKNTRGFADTNSYLRFVLLGMVLPVCVNSIFVYHYGTVKGDLDKVLLFWLSDFITILPLSTALLHFFYFDKKKQTIRLRPDQLHRKAAVELLAISALFIILSVLFPFDKYWFIYGIGATFFALRWGFSVAIILNVIIFMLSYLLPLFDFASSLSITQGSTQFANVHLGMSTMMFVSLLVGRVVTDLSAAEKNLILEKSQVESINNELQQANEELDRFVYSTSHDLSAPLKSIRGLVTLSKMEPHNSQLYLDKINTSVSRLEDFIDEVLDYSRTNRKSLTLESIDLRELMDEINSKLEFHEPYSKIKFSCQLKIASVISDRFLLRVALSNIISNAIKYQKKFESHQPVVEIRSFESDRSVIIEVFDNGEGIKAEYQDKLFNMFYRGTMSSSGSGLGLYIAKEAMQKLNGEISVQSVWGEGSTFRIQLPLIHQHN
jgi:signal transduction histidine kinase